MYDALDLSIMSSWSDEGSLTDKKDNERRRGSCSQTQEASQNEIRVPYMYVYVYGKVYGKACRGTPQCIVR